MVEILFNTDICNDTKEILNNSVKKENILYSKEILKDSKNIDISFEEWILPRLKCLCDNENGKPSGKESYEKWIIELKSYIEMLEFIINVYKGNSGNNLEKINYYWCLTTFQEYLKMTKHDLKTPTDDYIKELWICSYLKDLFYAWFYENHRHLWWSEW